MTRDPDDPTPHCTAVELEHREDPNDYAGAHVELEDDDDNATVMFTLAPGVVLEDALAALESLLPDGVAVEVVCPDCGEALELAADGTYAHPKP